MMASTMPPRDDRRSYLARRLRSLAHEFSGWREDYATHAVVRLHDLARDVETDAPAGALPAAPGPEGNTGPLDGGDR